MIRALFRNVFWAALMCQVGEMRSLFAFVNVDMSEFNFIETRYPNLQWHSSNGMCLLFVFTAKSPPVP